MVADMSVLRRGALEHLTPPKHWRSRAITFGKTRPPSRKVDCTMTFIYDLIALSWALSAVLKFL